MSLQRSIWQTHCRRGWTGWWISILLNVCRSMLIWMNSTRCQTTTGHSLTSSLFIRFAFRVRSKWRYSFRSLFNTVPSNRRKNSTLEYLPMPRRERRKCIDDHSKWSKWWLSRSLSSCCGCLHQQDRWWWTSLLSAQSHLLDSQHIWLSRSGISIRWSISVTSHRPCFCICTRLGTKIRFVADNRGAWFFSCHIEWHMSAGFAIVFLFSPKQLLANGYTVSPSQKTTVRSIQTSNLFFLNQSIVLSFPSITASVCWTRVTARREFPTCSLLIEGQLKFLLFSSICWLSIQVTSFVVDWQVNTDFPLVPMPPTMTSEPTPSPWTKDGQFYEPSAQNNRVTIGSDSGTLIFTEGQLIDQGLYQCNVTNICGNWHWQMVNPQRCSCSSRWIQVRRCRGKVRVRLAELGTFPIDDKARVIQVQREDSL